MVVIIDNYDSFSYNLTQYLGELGAEVRLFRNDQISPEQIANLAPTCIIISSGSVTSQNIAVGQALVKHFAGQIPLLGVSLGHQLIAEAFGGKISSAPQPMHGKTTPIYHDSKTIFKQIPAPFLGARYHSFVVKKATLPDCFEVSAWTKDGLIMGIRHKQIPVEGVQFHPESILTRPGQQLLNNFLHTYTLVNR